MKPGANNNDLPSFQFLNGAIKIISATVGYSNPKSFQFLNGAIKIKPI